MNERILELILFYPIFLFSLSLHEAAHAWMSNRFGDPTARLLGRITLNPLPHMDLLGTFILPVMGILTGIPLFGWGKPVPVNPRNLRAPRHDGLWIAIVGPISNIFLALIFAGLSRVLVAYLPSIPSDLQDSALLSDGVTLTYSLCHIGVIFNLMLAFFNMLPIFPLDGSNVLRGLLPERLVFSFDQWGRYGMFVLLLLYATRALSFLLVPVYAVANVLLPH